QAAVDVAADGDEILLADGVFIGDGNRDIDYAGKAITVRSASDNPANCILDCQASPGNPHRGFVFQSGESISSVLRGLTVTNAHVEGASPASIGAGMFCTDSSPQIINCIFLGNSARGGAGAACRGVTVPTAPHFTDCMFFDNETQLYGPGAGLYCHLASPRLKGCAFAGNSPGGMYSHAYSSPELDDCSFSGHPGLGLGCDAGVPSIENCRFHDNLGIAFRSHDATLTMSRCSFWHNHGTNGAALYLDWDFSGTISDCLIYGNTADESGGAVWCGTGSATFINCSMAYNEAGSGAGGIDCGSATITLGNTIIAFSTGGQAIAGNASLSCCDLYGNAGGDWVGDIASQYGLDGNISEDPIFCDPWDDDFTLQSDSPCAPFSLPNPECDLIGSEPIGCEPPTAVLPPAEDATWGGVKALFRSPAR
ncbi:MAG: right-handed parallel beta-helix repeat-containing protein, partial [Candidatus Eisenbacteria sp.]|nr:right-handed parallel beta-helix repeat-containing protein [Candidatus Eisenbacteria bacterium]